MHFHEMAERRRAPIERSFQRLEHRLYPPGSSLLPSLRAKGKPARLYSCRSCSVALAFLDRELDLSDELRFVASWLVFQVEFAIGAADSVAVGLNPLEDRAVCFLHHAETTVMDHRCHRLDGREFDDFHLLPITQVAFKCRFHHVVSPDELI